MEDNKRLVAKIQALEKDNDRLQEIQVQHDETMAKVHRGYAQIIEEKGHQANAAFEVLRKDREKREQDMHECYEASRQQSDARHDLFLKAQIQTERKQRAEEVQRLNVKHADEILALNAKINELEAKRMEDEAKRMEEEKALREQLDQLATQVIVQQETFQVRLDDLEAESIAKERANKKKETKTTDTGKTTHLEPQFTPKDPRYKTQLCKHGKHCWYGSACCFAHGEAELRPKRA